MAALLCCSQLGLLSKDNYVLLLPCHDKQCLNEKEQVQSMVPFFNFFFFFLQLKQGSAHMPGEEEQWLLQAKPATAWELGANARDKAINSEEGPSRFLWLLGRMCCINANPVTP